MAKYHINGKGEPGKCSAEKGNCPFGSDDEHYTSAAAARTAYEKRQANSSEEFSKVEQAIQDYGKNSSVFRSWSAIHRDYKSTTDGRSVLVMGPRGTTLVPWLGPKALERYESTLKNIEVMDRQQELASNPPASFAGYSPTINPIDLKKAQVGERYYDLEGTAYIVESTNNKDELTMNPIDDDGKPLGDAGRGVIPVTETRNAGRFYKLVNLSQMGTYVDSSGGSSESKIVKELPSAGSFDRAVSAGVQYRDEEGNLQTMELIAKVDRLSDKKRIELGRQLWAFTGKDPKRYEDVSDEEKLRWASQRIMRRKNFSWERKDGHVSYSHDTGSGWREAENIKLVEL